MAKLMHYLTVFLTIFVLGGVVFLTYIEKVDGVYINKPLTWQMGMNPEALQTDKTIYRIGDVVELRVSVCRNRDFTSDTTWKLWNETVQTFPDMGLRVSGKGCTIDKLSPVGVIPAYAVPGVHHIEGEQAIVLNSDHTVYYHYRSVDFQVQ